MKRAKINERKKHQVFFRDNYTCRACGFFDTYGFGLVLDHITAHADGGTDDIENLQCLCSTCNLIKSNKDAPVLAIRNHFPKSASYGLVMSFINENRQDFFKHIYPRSKGWFNRKEKTLALLDLGEWKPAQRKRLGEAMAKTFGYKKTFLDIESKLGAYRCLVDIATPATQECELAY